MPKTYIVRLTEAEREHLERLVRKGKAHARKLLYARILLKADANAAAWTDERIAEALEISTATVARERRRFCEERLKEVALMPKKPGRGPGGGGCSTVVTRRTLLRFRARLLSKAGSAGV